MNLANTTSRISGSVRHIDRLMGSVEAILLAVVGRVASWLASVPCAVMTARASMEIFRLSWPLAVIVSIALELVGQTTSNLWMNARSWNKDKRRKSDPEANENLALGLMIAYFVIDTAIIVVLAIADFIRLNDWRQFIAVLYPIVAIISTLALNQRIAQFRRESAIEQEKAGRAETRKRNRKSLPQPAALPPIAEYDTRERALEILRSDTNISGSALGRAVGLSERQGRNLKAELLPEVGGNGHRAKEMGN